MDGLESGSFNVLLVGIVTAPARCTLSLRELESNNALYFTLRFDCPCPDFSSCFICSHTHSILSADLGFLFDIFSSVACGKLTSGNGVITSSDFLSPVVVNVSVPFAWERVTAWSSFEFTVLKDGSGKVDNQYLFECRTGEIVSSSHLFEDLRQAMRDFAEGEGVECTSHWHRPGWGHYENPHSFSDEWLHELWLTDKYFMRALTAGGMCIKCATSVELEHASYYKFHNRSLQF